MSVSAPIRAIDVAIQREFATQWPTPSVDDFMVMVRLQTSLKNTDPSKFITAALLAAYPKNAAYRASPAQAKLEATLNTLHLFAVAQSAEELTARAEVVYALRPDMRPVREFIKMEQPEEEKTVHKEESIISPGPATYSLVEAEEWCTQELFKDTQEWMAQLTKTTTRKDITKVTRAMFP